MLKKENRLKKNWQFQDNFRKGGVNNSGRFLCLINHQKKKKKCLFGISIPKKISKKSTKRNRYKRQVSEMINFFLKEKNFCSNNNHIHRDIVIIIKKKYEEGKFCEKKEELRNLIKHSYEKKRGLCR